jgi:hypothetical protein
VSKPPKPDDEIEHEDTQIFDSKKHPLLKREPARKTGAPPTRPTPRQPQDTPPPLEPQATRVVVMHVPPEAIPNARERPSQAFVVPRERPSQPIATPRSSDDATRAVEVTPSRRSKAPSAAPIVEPALARTVIAEPLFARTVIAETPIPAARTVIAEIDAGATAPVLKIPPELRATFDSNPALQAIDGRADSLGGDHVETNPMAVPLHAMAAQRSTAPMPIPEHTKIGVVERPLVAPPARAKPATTPPSHSAAIEMLDAARVRQIPDRVALVTPTAMNVVMPEGPHAALRGAGDSHDHDDDNYNETRERPIDREALRKLSKAADIIALSATVPAPAILDPPSSPVVLTGPPKGGSEPRMEVARPPAPRGGLVWLWMVLAALAIAAAVATAMWYLAS